MKVVYIAHSAGIQGAGIALYNIIKSGERRFKPIVVFPNDGELPEKLKELGVRCYIINRYHNFLKPRLKNLKDWGLFIPRSFRILWNNRVAKSRLRRIVRSEKPDIIHTNTGVLPFGVDVAKEAGIPHVWHLREYLNESTQYYYYYWGYKYFRKRAVLNNNHCVSITKLLFDYYNLKESKDKVIYDGVFSEKDLIQPKQNIDEKYFLFVGTLSRGKGVFDALDAFEAIADKVPEYNFYLAGLDNDNVREYVDKLKSNSRIKLLGFRNDRYQLMANARSLIVPSLCEGFGFIVVEGMLNKCLVIGRDTAGIKEQFDNGKLISGEDIGLRFSTQKELEEQMLKSVNISPLEYDKITASAYSVVKELYSCEKDIDNLLNLYQRICRKQG